MDAGTSSRGPKARKYLNIPGQSLQFNAPAITPPQAMTGGRGGMGLPLSIVSLIIARIDDLGDLSRLCRTSRLMYYMALSKLYEDVTLRSYPEVRRVNGRVEGLGGGSPICMALGALATSQCASVVRYLTIQGSWEETNEYMLGRIPDSTVLLSIAVRAAIDKTVNMQSFTWKLDTKALRVVYQGLSLRDSLTSFTIQFPSSRTPRPVLVMPAIPSLRKFAALNLDPLCYNDDISHLLYGSTNLEDLTLHWSPRMRLEVECSTSLNAYFGKCIQDNRKLPVKKISMQNFYGPNRGQMYQTLDQDKMESTHFLDMFGGAHGPRTNVFIDETWRRIPPVLNFKWKIHRSNELAIQHTRILRGFRGLEQLYLVSKSLGNVPSPVDTPTFNGDTQSGGVHQYGSPRQSSTKHSSAYQFSSPRSTTTHTHSNPSTPDPGVTAGSDLNNLGNEYIDAILGSHGPTLKTLLMFDKFGLNESQLADIAMRAQGIEHLGVALEGSEDVFRQLIPSMTNLKSLRILENDLIRRLGVFEDHNLTEVCKEFGRQIYRSGNDKLEWIGIGDLVFRVGVPQRFEVKDRKEDWRCPLTRASWDDVIHLGLWGMDKLEL
ncbi:hypothetical protein CAC42_3000 [Sphaceloma murrayae]|uniref:Uncharacterized protein n=1 Tax=Sphaceloma murrayae TaxID=2082308 RepID=A0A2K1QRC1_9PEZI|nr:hypothetical protein CAC42_3000 [Sphaceloma murrayae]